MELFYSSALTLKCEGDVGGKEGGKDILSRRNSLCKGHRVGRSRVTEEQRAKRKVTTEGGGRWLGGISPQRGVGMLAP